MDYIEKIIGREILNARGKPTVEAEIITKNGIRAFASVPSGTSTGIYEAKALYDGQPRYEGKGTKKAAANVSGEISSYLHGTDITDQAKIDQALCKLDGTEDKSRLGANAVLAVSAAAARAGAMAKGLPLYKYLAEKREGGCKEEKLFLPHIVATVIAGGVFSDSGLEFEDYMAVFRGFSAFSQELDALAALRGRLEKKLREKYGAFPEDGGALAPPLKSTEEAFFWILETAKDLNIEDKVTLGLDVAASELWDNQGQMYTLGSGKKQMAAKELSLYYEKLYKDYPLTFIEDGFHQDDFQSFAWLGKRIPEAQIVGDDLFATNPKRLSQGIALRAGNGLLLKMNQIGTVTEAVKAAQMARKHHYDVIVSLRSGETTDDFIADLAVAVGAGQIKLGSPVRAERNAKYNRLLRIEEELREEKTID